MRRVRRVVTTLVLVALALGRLSAQAPPAGEVRYYHTDAIGSVRMITDAGGNVVARIDYTPFGQEVGSPASPDPRRFTGKERDPQTGFDYSGARYYASGYGRFTTVDPAMKIEATLVDPQRWNRYGYALNNPLKFTDPDGRNPVLFKLLELAQRAASSPVAQRAQQAVVNQGARAWVALTRLFNTPEGEELVQTAAELATGADLGPMAGPSAASIGAVIGHYNAGYVKAGRELGVAVFDIPIDIWKGMSPNQRQKANQAFLDTIVEKRLTIQVVTNGFVRPGSTLRWEIDYLLGQGYTFSKSGDTLLPPK